MDASSPLDSSIESLETAFSDSTRRLTRLVHVEWQRVLKCKDDLTSKDLELQTVQENVKRLQEMKFQNENYFKSAEKRLQDLKLSNAEFRKQISKFQYEKEKVMKNCSEQEENARQKISFYQEKWLKRYEAHYSENPRMFEESKRINEVHELQEKLLLLTEEEKKYERDLCRVKSKRSVITKGRKFYPFQNFVLNVATVYLESKKIYDEGEKVFKEIEDIESRIQSERQIFSQGKMLRSENSLNAVSNLGQNVTTEISNMKNNLEYFEDKMHGSYNIVKESAKDVNIESNVKSKTDYVKSVSNNVFGAANPSCNIDIKCNTLETKENDCTTKAAKVLQQEPKARKWLERLKIFVPKFRGIAEENDAFKDRKNSTKLVVSVITNVEEKTETYFPQKNLNDVQSKAYSTNAENFAKSKSPLKTFSMDDSGPNITSLSVQKGMFDDTTLRVPENTTLRQLPNKNTSKYFRKVDEVDAMDWGNEHTHEKRDLLKYAMQDINSRKSEDKRNTEQKTTENRNIFNQEVLYEPMDTDKQSNERKLFTENMKETKTNEVTCENQEMSNLMLHKNHENKTKLPLDSFETNINSPILHGKLTLDQYQTKNLGSSLLQTKHKRDIEQTLEHEEPSNYSSILNVNETMEKYQNRDGNSLMQTNSERETEASVERSGTCTFSPVLNENDLNRKCQNKNANSDEIYKDMTVQLQIDNDKVINVVNNEPMSDNVITDISKQHQLHHFMDTDISQASAISKNYSLKVGVVSPKEINIHEESRAINPQTAAEISNKSTQLRISPSPVDYSPKNLQPKLKIPSDSNPKTPASIDSNPKTPLTRQLKNSGESVVQMDSSNYPVFKGESPSTGFAYSTRLMYPINATSSKTDQSEITPKDPRCSLFAQMSFFGQTSPKNFDFNETRSPEDSSRFLSDYENYLTDSPPVIKGTEKSMFAFAEESPENEDKNDFFPLFASSTANADGDAGSSATGFTFNFAGNNQAQSPDENPGFKLLF